MAQRSSVKDRITRHDWIDLRQAAACAMAASRDDRYVEVLGSAIETEVEAEVKQAMQRSAAVLAGGNLSLIAEDFQKLSQDQAPRPRIFGGA